MVSNTESFIDRDRIKKVFADYVADYNQEDDKIILKVKHTYRVAAISDELAGKIGLSGYDRDLAWLIGMLHDIGRFEQLRRYNTFVDADSIDHAKFGVQLLFEEGLLWKFLDNESVSEEDVRVLEKAIGNHSAFRIEKALSERELQYAKIIRDADKIDILKVASDVPLEIIYNVTTEQIHAAPVSDAVMEQFGNEQAILRADKRVPIDNLVGHIALVFELEFSESYRLVREQGYLTGLLGFQTHNSRLAEQFDLLRRQMNDFLNRKLTDSQTER